MKYPVLFHSDDYHRLTLYTLGLEQKEYTLEIVTSLFSAIENIKKLPYPVIISDYRLTRAGKTSGFTLLDEAGKNNRYTKVILISGYGENCSAHALTALEKGALYHFTQPVDCKKLNDCIIRAIRTWEQEIEESINLGFLKIDYISRLFCDPGIPGYKQEKETTPDLPTVMIHYPPCDIKRVEMISRVLKKNGIHAGYTVIQESSGEALFPGDGGKGQGSPVILLFISSEGIHSGWVAEQKEILPGDHIKDNNINVIPVIVDDDVEIPGWLADKNILDLRMNMSEKITELISIIKNE